MLMRKTSLEDEVEALGPWFHNMRLGSIQTAPDHPLGDYPALKWRHFRHAVVESIPGRTVLDIGCNAGFYSIEMKRLGAKRVVAIDYDDRYLAQARLAARVCNVDIEFHRMSVYDVACLAERFDVVLFMGVLYHLRNPLLALDLIHEHVADDLLVFQSMQCGSSDVYPIQPDYDFWSREHFFEPAYPKLHFVEHRFAGDPTNWWIPNRACSEAMLRSSGFDVIERAEEEVYICRKSPLEESLAVYPARGPL